MRFRLLAALLPVALAAAPLQAQSFTPTGSFGSLPQANFGGSGIPNNAVMRNTYGGVTLGLTATQRFSAPAVTNNAAGTYYAYAGAGSPTTYGLWNFDFFIGGQNTGNYTYALYYDFDPAANTLVSNHGKIMLPAGSQNSWNLGMFFLDTNLLGTQPTYSSFDPNAAGSYTFALAQYDANQAEVGLVAIDVVTATPEPATLTLMASGLFGIGFVARRRRRA
jgi:hypothetical protein